MRRAASHPILFLLLVSALILTGPSLSRADDARVMLLEDTLDASRLHYPLLISEGRGYRIRCDSQADEEAVIQGLGFTSVPSQILSAVDAQTSAADPASNPLLCPTDATYPIKIFAHDSGSGMVHYLQFPSAIGASTFTDRIYVPGCKGLADALLLDLTQALDADPTPFFAGKIHRIACLTGPPLDDPPNTFAKWCAKGDRTAAETATVMAVLDSTPGGVAALGNPAACDEAQSFLTSISILNLNGTGVQALEPVAVLAHLTSLSLAGNAIADLGPLKTMRALTSLDLADNDLGNINALAPLTLLTRLSIAGNHVSDIRALSGLAQLTNLTLDRNSIADLSPLQLLSALSSLSIAANGLTGEMLDPLSALGGLILLNLADNNIEAFANLGNFPSTLTINLAGNPIVAAGGQSFADICVLNRDAATPFGQTVRALVALQGGGTCSAVGNALLATTSLDLSAKIISDLRPLASLPHLTDLNLSANAITDLSPLSGLIHLTTLNLKTNAITDVRPLAPLTGLINFDISENPIQISDFLSACLMRQQTDAVSGPQAREVNALLTISGKTTCGEAATDLKDRQFAEARGQGLLSVNFFPVMANLTALDVSDNNLTDLGALAAIPGLTSLRARNNQISSLQAVLALRRLEQLSLDGNPLQNIFSIGQLNKLTRLYVSDTQVRSILPLADLPMLVDAGMRNLALNYGSFAEYCLVYRFDSIALGNNRAFMAAIDSRMQADHVDTGDCGAVDNWVQAQTVLSLNTKSIIAVGPIAFFRSLQELHLFDNSISDATPIASLTNLRKLNLSTNKLTSFPRLGSTGLRELLLSENRISDLGNLSGMTQLTDVSLRGNRVSDGGPLASNTGLASVDLRGNLIGQNDSFGIFSYIDKTYLGDNPICASFATINPDIAGACDREPLFWIRPELFPLGSGLSRFVESCNNPPCLENIIIQPGIITQPGTMDRIFIHP